MVHLPGAIAGNTSTSEEVLAAEPGLLVDERLVRPGQDRALVDNLPEVVRVLEEPVYLRIAQGGATVLLGHATA